MKRYVEIIVCMWAIIIMQINFASGIFIVNEEEKENFKNFQQDSEALVIGKMYQMSHKSNNNKYGLQYIFQKIDNKKIIYITKDYKSQVGLQGFIFSKLNVNMNIPINVLNGLCALFTSIVIVCICFLLYKKYDAVFATVFYIVFLLSPWIVNFARNLYWVPFTWFLPLLFCLLLDKTENKKVFLPLIFLSVFFKSLCGYEYLSTILITSVVFFVTDFITTKDKRKKKKIFIIILEVGIISILAFLLAISIHAYLRGDGKIIKGLDTIYKEDVLRRTISNNADLFDEQIVKESIKASHIEVLKKYFIFSTEIIYLVPGKFFAFIVSISLVILIINLVRNKKNVDKDTVLYLMFFISTISWHVLAKAHSFVHLHMNYVLWYFGFIQMTFYLIINECKEIIDLIIKRKENICEK